MKNLTLLFISLFPYTLFSQPGIEWAHCFGGTQPDGPFSIQRTIDHGFILAGQAASVDGDVAGNHGNGDAWIVKLDSMGNLNT